MSKRGAREGLFNGLMYALIAGGSLPLVAWAGGESYTDSYRILSLVSGIACFIWMRGISPTSPWQIGRPASPGTRVLTVWAVIVTALIFVGYFGDLGAGMSRTVMGVWMVLVPGLLVLCHVALRYGILRMFPNLTKGRSAVVLFVNDSARKLATQVSDAGYEIVGYFEDREPSRTGGALHDIPHLGKTATAADYVREHGIEVVFIVLPEGGFERALALINEMGDTTASIFYVPDWYVFSMMPSQFYEIRGIPVFEVIETPFYGVDGLLKRGFDIVFSATALIASIPLMAVIAIAVKLDSKGPVIFKQKRYGLNGEAFAVHKFRSMSVMEDDEKVEQVSRTDPRVTRVGKFLRRTSLDEWPQFWTVLRGDMSVVGPRPHAVAHNEYYRRAIQGYMARHKVKPGVTGLAQVNGYRGETQTLDRMEKRIEYDLEYIRSWSPLLDLKIIVLTLVMISRDENAY